MVTNVFFISVQFSKSLSADNRGSGNSRSSGVGVTSVISAAGRVSLAHLERDHGRQIVGNDWDGRIAPAVIKNRVRRCDAGAFVLAVLANLGQRCECRGGVWRATWRISQYPFAGHWGCRSALSQTASSAPVRRPF
jgi:hypothetical protein